MKLFPYYPLNLTAALPAFFLCFQVATNASAQTVPRAGESGLQPKILDQSRPRFQPPGELIPDIQIEDAEPGTSAADGTTLKVRAIHVEGARLIDASDLEKLVNDYISPLMTIGQLNKLAGRVTAYYIEAGYLLVRAYIPPQEVKNGVVAIHVQVGKVTGISLQGQSRFAKRDLLRRMKPILEEESLRKQTLERALLELNDIPGLEVKSSIKRGADPNTSNLFLQVRESRPYYFSFDADNFGSRFTGRDRFGVTETLGSLLRFGDQFNLRVVRSDSGLNFINPSYSIPITPYGTDLTLSYIFANHQLGSTLATLNGGGETNIFALSVSHPLYRTRNASLNITAGLSFRFFENYLLDTKTSDDDMTDAFVGVDGFISDNLQGRTFFNLRLQAGFREGDVNDPFNSRFLGRGNVVVGSGSITRYQSVFFLDSYLVLKVMGQGTSGRVLSPDLFASGGIGTVRGYPLAEVTGDNAYLLSAEYVLPVPIDYRVTGNGPTIRQLFSVFGFIDNSRVFVLNPQSGESDLEITGAGVGLKLNIPKTKDNHLAVNFTFAWGTPVLGSPQASDGSRSILYFGGQVQF